MDQKQNIKDLEKSLLRDLGKMTKILDTHLSTLPEEAMNSVAPIRADITKALKKIKTQDVSGINEIIDKYANPHR